MCDWRMSVINAAHHYVFWLSEVVTRLMTNTICVFESCHFPHLYYTNHVLFSFYTWNHHPSHQQRRLSVIRSHTHTHSQTIHLLQCVGRSYNPYCVGAPKLRPRIHILFYSSPLCMTACAWQSESSCNDTISMRGGCTHYGGVSENTRLFVKILTYSFWFVQKLCKNHVHLCHTRKEGVQSIVFNSFTLSAALLSSQSLSQMTLFWLLTFATTSFHVLISSSLTRSLHQKKKQDSWVIEVMLRLKPQFSIWGRWLSLNFAWSSLYFMLHS